MADMNVISPILPYRKKHSHTAWGLIVVHAYLWHIYYGIVRVALQYRTNTIKPRLHWQQVRRFGFRIKPQFQHKIIIYIFLLSYRLEWNFIQECDEHISHRPCICARKVCHTCHIFVSFYKLDCLIILYSTFTHCTLHIAWLHSIVV